MNTVLGSCLCFAILVRTMPFVMEKDGKAKSVVRKDIKMFFRNRLNFSVINL